MEESNDRTNKANMVLKPNHFKGKNTTNIFPGILWAPTKFKSNSRAIKVHVLCVGNPGHYARECRYRKDQKIATVNAIDEEIIAILSDVCVVQGKVQGWWYDTCTTVHVTYEKYVFKTFEDTKGDLEF